MKTIEATCRLCKQTMLLEMGDPPALALEGQPTPAGSEMQLPAKASA